MLNEKKIKQFCETNGYGYNYFGDTAIITTGVDQWCLELIEIYNNGKYDTGERVKLKHNNSKANKSGKTHFHTQRYVNNINYAFETIVSHEENSRDFNKVFDIKNIIDYKYKAYT